MSLPSPPDVGFHRFRHRWLGWTLLGLTPFVGAGLFYFHVVVAAGAAGGCGGG